MGPAVRIAGESINRESPGAREGTHDAPSKEPTCPRPDVPPCPRRSRCRPDRRGRGGDIRRRHPRHSGRVAPEAECESAESGLADTLAKDITAALKGKDTSAAVSLHDRTTGTTCSLDGDRTYDSASVVKIIVLGTLLRDAQQEDRQLTADERDLATAMITQSDNDATTTLWKRLGPTKVKDFLAAAGMTHTTLDGDGAWGSPRSRRMTSRPSWTSSPAPTRRSWTTPRARTSSTSWARSSTSSAGAPGRGPSTAEVHVKNGWLERDTHGWRVHSVGAFTGGGHDYSITVLTQDNDTMDDGVAAIEAVARVVHKDLNASG
ncbi:serine hydrolase [Streptomyces sp. M19]